MKIIGYILIIVFAVHFVGNLLVVLRYAFFKKHASTVPLVGGICGAIGFLLSSQDILQHLWWIPLLIDPGSALWLFFCAKLILAPKKGA